MSNVSNISAFLPLAKINANLFRQPPAGSDVIDVIVYRRPDYSELEGRPDTVFFDDLYATVGPTARHMKGGAGDSAQ